MLLVSIFLQNWEALNKSIMNNSVAQYGEYTQEYNQYANEIISPDVDGYEINVDYLYDLPTGKVQVSQVTIQSS